MRGWLEAEESSVLRLVTGVVLFGGIGGEGFAGTTLAPPAAWARSPEDRSTVTLNPDAKCKSSSAMK